MVRMTIAKPSEPTSTSASLSLATYAGAFDHLPWTFYKNIVSNTSGEKRRWKMLRPSSETTN